MSTVLPRRVTSLIALLAVAFGGCSVGTRPAMPPPVAARVPPASTGVSPSSPISPEPTQAPRNSVKALLVGPIAEEPRDGRDLISFSVKNVDFKDVLLGLSRMSNSNIIFEQDIAGKVSVDLKDVTVEEALKSLLPPMSLEFTRDGRTIHITKQKVQTRIFPLNYIATRRKGESQVYATSSSSSASTASATGGATAPGAAPTTGGTQGSADQTVGFTRLKGEDSANLWEDVKTTLDGLLSPQGKYSLNPLAGIVVVTDFPSRLDRMAAYFEAVETSVRRQVLIQAEILEIILTEDFEYGIDFAWLQKKGKFAGTNPGLQDGGPPKSIFSQLLNPRSGVFNIGLADATVAAVLDLLQTEGKVRVLSRPSVSTLNSQKAIIKVATDDVFFQTNTLLTVQGLAQTNVTQQNVTLGVVLSVTPQIASDGYIIMDVHPTVTDSTQSRTFKSGDVVATAPVVDVRETNTVLRVRDGESIVIAGLVKTKKDREVRRVPLLSSIPVIGVLFQQLKESSQNTELVIKITPRIVGDSH